MENFYIDVFATNKKGKKITKQIPRILKSVFVQRFHKFPTEQELEEWLNIYTNLSNPLPEEPCVIMHTEGQGLMYVPCYLVEEKLKLYCFKGTDYNYYQVAKTEEKAKEKLISLLESVYISSINKAYYNYEGEINNEFEEKRDVKLFNDPILEKANLMKFIEAFEQNKLPENVEMLIFDVENFKMVSNRLGLFF